MEYEVQILGKFVEHPRKELFDIVQRYLNSCDAFDEIHCTGIRDGIRIPNNTTEAIIIQKHAKELKQELLMEAKQKGFSETDFKKALITSYCT